MLLSYFQNILLEQLDINKRTNDTEAKVINNKKIFTIS